MTEEHGYELRLRFEAFGVFLRLVFGHQVVKVRCDADGRKYLTEQTRCLYHLVCPFFLF